jgi:hypothetical protein
LLAGGTKVFVQGIGWKMSDLEVEMGTVTIPAVNITQINANNFFFFAPPVSGPSRVTIRVRSKGMVSNELPYSYLAADQPVPKFKQTPFSWEGTFDSISCGAWCHGRYFFAGTSGLLFEVRGSQQKPTQPGVWQGPSCLALWSHSVC